MISSYLSGRRQPGVSALARIVAAAGLELDLSEHHTPVDPQRAGRLLEQVIELAEALPFRRDEALAFPTLTPPR